MDKVFQVLHPDKKIPIFPAVPARMLGVFPFAPMSLSLTFFARKIAKSHPGLFRRLGSYDHSLYILDPTDLPFVIWLEPNGGTPRVTVSCGSDKKDATRIAGPLAALLGLVHGDFDGDALFFSRDLVIEGDTAAALALRNAVDDAELDLAQVVIELSGLFAGPLGHLIDIVQRRTGVSLSRHETAQAW